LRYSKGCETRMPRQSVGRISVRTVTAHKKKYRQVWIHIPRTLTEGKGFPFNKAGDEVLIIVDEKKQRLIVEKLKPRTVGRR